MSEKLIPEHIDPFRYAEQNLSVSGIVHIVDMQRLRPNLSAIEGHVSVQLQLGVDEQEVVFLKGQIKTTLSLLCQRCMEPFVYEIMSDFMLGIVTTLDQANDLPRRYEPVLVKEGSLALRELVEEEILLNLPIIPRHTQETCKVKLPLSDAEWEESKKKNPFHVLESIKGKQRG